MRRSFCFYAFSCCRQHHLERTSAFLRAGEPSTALTCWLANLCFASQIRPKEDQDGILASLSAADLENSLDLRPFMQRHPCVLLQLRAV